MKLRNLAGAFLALAGLAFCGSAFADGSIWDIVGKGLDGTSKSKTYGPQETIKFKMRLLSPNWDEPEADREAWAVKLNPDGYYGENPTKSAYPTYPESVRLAMAEASNPLQLGIVARGVVADSVSPDRVAGAVLSGAPQPSNEGRFTDLTFVYTTQNGDFALPLRVATDAEGNAIGENPDAPGGEKYFFKNGPGDTANPIWIITTPSGKTFVPTVSGVSATEGDLKYTEPVRQKAATGGDFLRACEYAVKTMAFEDHSVTIDGEEYWYSVHEGSVTKDPKIRTTNGEAPTMADLRLYAWFAPGDGDDADPKTWSWTNETEYAAIIPTTGQAESVMRAEFRDPDGSNRVHSVYVFTINSAPPYPFGIKGQHRGQTARVILSRTPQFNWVGDAGSSGVHEVLNDFLSAKVRCEDPEPPTISVSIADLASDRTIRYGTDVTYKDARELKVSLNTPTNEPMKVRLDFKWGKDGGKTSFPTNIIAVSHDDIDGYLVKNLLEGMEVTIPANKTELEGKDRIYLFVLGATTSTENPEEGITITPVPEAKYASYIQTTNAQPFRIVGMNPDIIAPLGTKEEPAALTDIRGGSKLRCRIELDDSWRNLNLSSNDIAQGGGYMVRWNRGYGSELTITNDYNGGVLKPVLNSDGRGWFEIGVEYTSVTGTYHSSFMVTNPEGHESVVSYVDVTTIPRATVSATLPDMPQTADGFYETMESDTDKRTVRFQLSDILEADGQELWAFLEPANEAASNRTDGAFFTKTNATGVPIDTMSSGMGSTSLNYKLGGIQVLDGDGAGDGSGSTAQYNVILCTQATYAADKVFKGYDGANAITLLLDNHKPEFKQLVLRQKAASATKYDLVDSKITNGTTVAASVGINNAIRVEPRDKGNGWNDVARDLNAPTNEQIVVRWRVYEYDGAEEVLSELKYTFKTNNWLNDAFLDLEGFPTVGRYKVVANIQDKDMRVEGAVVEADEDDEDHPDGWIYYTDPDYEEEGDYDTWQADVSDWGPDFTFIFEVSDLQNLVVEVEGTDGTQSGDPYYSERQLPPFTEDGGIDERMRVRLTLGNKTITELRNAVITARVDIVASGDVHGGFVTPWSTNVVFNGTGSEAKRTKTFQLEGFDGTYRNGQPGAANMAKYTVNATILGEAARYYNVVTEDFRVANVSPELTVTSPDLSEYIDSGEAKPITKGDWIDLAFSAMDIRPDLTNMTVTCTIAKGKGEFDDKSAGPRSLISTEASVDYEGGAYTNAFRFQITGSGTNIVKIVAKDKDGDRSEEHQIWFFIEPTHNLILYPAKPTSPTTDSGDVADYFSASGIGYGRVWADSTLSGISEWIQTWATPLDLQSVRAYAMGYRAGEQEGKNEDNKPPFVDSEGGVSGTTGYTSPLADLDSFFYRWFAKVAGDSKQEGSWTSYLPIPQLSFVTNVVKSQTVLPLEWPQKTGNDATVFNDISALAIFSREKMWSDNMGDINGDWVPDSYVMKYKLVEDYTGGNDLKDVNYSEDGKTPNCQDYLPLTDAIRYSKLIPALTSYDNIENAAAFTPRLKIRGYDDNLNDAVAEYLPNDDGTLTANPAFVDGAKPEKVYAMPDGSYNAASCTVSRVEYLAWKAFAAANLPEGAVTNKAYFSRWSPERPTDPTKADTDNDGITDGLEYYWWYRAHVGYLDGDVLRKATGRRYNPRNPGEGDFISAAEIERTFDPLTPIADKKQDTDNDGLPDLIEFEIGTNPFDFDTDGDGLPDGFEIMLGGTDPLLAETTKGVSDAMRNFDGDAMAFTTPFLETKYVKPVPLVTDMLYTFALVDADGDTDGVQWYVGKTSPKLEDLQPLETCVTGTSFTVGGKTYVTPGKVPVVDGRLAADLDKAVTWEVLTRASLTNSIPSLTNLTWIAEGEPDPESGEPTLTTNATDLVALMPTRFAAGTEVTGVKTATYATLKFAADVTGVNAAWVYGRSVTAVTTGDSLANIGGFGMLAIGRYQDAPKGVRIAALPAEDDGVAYLHHFVYQEFGFDPRTAWNANTPLAPRWGKTVGEGESTETVANNTSGNYGYAGISTRTREYTLYDEFLVLSFFLNNGKLTKADVTATEVMPWEKIWSRYTTNGQGPNEPNWAEDNDHYKGRTVPESGEQMDDAKKQNGADTDFDGVPDGWELYVMAGPKVYDKKAKEFKYNLVAPYNDGFFSAFGPFVGDAAKASTTDNTAAGANETAAGDGDGLTELQEYAGTDSCAYYCEPWNGNAAAFSATIVRPEEHAKWLNKFFPTDPWNKDTDGDGLNDNEFANQGDFKCARFMYGTPVDDGKKCCIPGGGLNPCTVDTDRDGLPDPWEAQFAGQTVYAGEDRQVMKGKNGEEGNPLQGLCDGMDGTVFDAYSSPRINNAEENYTVSLDGVDQVVDRDYDRDGLENWQEYLTGAMRCWRYDDPITVWDYVPDAAFFNPMTGAFDLAAAMRHTGIKNENEFWYRLLFDTTSKWYNPHFVTASTPSSQYFSRVTNGWDQVFAEAGTYYMFHNRRNGDLLESTWGEDHYNVKMAPRKYICTSPIAADTDQDGMDDGYELFHGMNPILGAAAVLKDSNGPCDIVYDAWYVKGVGSPVNALENPWIDRIPGNGKYDFIAHPWLNGLVDADPDGDDIRNQDEAIMPLVAPSAVWLHTDPTPLWMTDSSYGDSIVSRFFRLPSARGMVPVPDSIVFGGKEYSLVNCDGYMVLPIIGPVIAPFLPDYWSVTGEGAANWAYSFEENEGYDTDHDSGSDFEEKQGKFRNATDPQDADSPRRRQAMYFPGQNAALQSMPFVKEGYPRAAMGYPDDMSFLQYTVECWVRPEAADPAKVYTVLERTSFTDPSHVADERYVRRNFAIQIRNGKWCTAFDTNGTLDDSLVEVIGKTDVEVGAWTHVAATYDANRLTLYVNGNEDGYVLSSLKPEYGSSAVVTYPAGSGSVNTNDLVVDGSLEALQGTAHAYWFDSEYAQYAFLIGASFANASDGNHLDVTQQMGWGRYKEFFKGYVDEVRVWDGAQPADVVFSHFSARKRFTREDALENRSAFYKQWADGRRRYSKDGDGLDHDVTPELRFHWAFDSIPGAENAAAVAQAPHGFLEGVKPIYSRPYGYQIPWWSGVVGAYGSVYKGERNWVPWIPNTVTHLPRLDMTTLDSAYWSENYAGDEAGTYRFARTAEPVSKWTQYVRNGTDRPLEFRTTGRRFWLTHNTGTNATSTLPQQFEFTGRHLNQTGDDLLPLGGAFAKYVDVMWDDQGASSMWEQTGLDDDGDGLPNWWQEYANQNCREGVPEGTDITWDTLIWYEIGGERVRITAGEAYRRDLAKGAYRDAHGEIRFGPTDYAQTAKSDGLIPDWWKELRKIDGEQPLADLDNDGLNNYVEYVASELLPFRLNLDPRMAKSDTKTLDYFRKVGRLYLGEMLTDHDQMEDHWERSLGDESVASAALWDALKDGEEDGWNNFAENRYNGYAMSTLAQLVSHAMGDNEVLDAPIPSIKMRVLYNGDRPLVLESQTGTGDNIDDPGDYKTPALIVSAFSKNADTGSYVLKPDAIWTIRPGVPVEKEVYLGGWEDRVVRGTLAPGYVDLGSVNILFAQVPQNDLYSWTDESGTHLAGTYKEFKEAFDKNPNIIQNIQNFEWLSLYAPVNEYTSADRAVTVTRNEKGQENARFAVYGEPVGTINLSTGDFEFDLGAMNRLRVNYTFDGGKGPAAAWSYKEAIFKITYSAKVSSEQLSSLDFSLAKSDPNIITPDGSLVKASFVRGGLNSFQAFYDLDNSGTWDPGEPFGVVNDVEIGWAGRDVEIELSDMSAITPRVKLWGAGGESSGGNGGGDGKETASASATDSDRGTRVGVETFSDVSNRFEVSTAPAPKSRVRVVRYKVDKFPVYKVGVDAGVVLEKDFEEESRDFLHEGDFLADGDLDIDWKNLYSDVVDWRGAQAAACEVTNVTYLIVYNWDKSEYASDKDTNTQVKANATLVTRRFEVTRTVPTPCPERAVYNQSRPVFSWKIAGEDKWASWFGTTYTAFKVRVKDLKGKLVYDSGVRRLPAMDSEGVYTWAPPLYVGEKAPGSDVIFQNLTDYTWEVAVYNAKFKTDTLYAMELNDTTGKKVFSAPLTFRMNVTKLDTGSAALAVRACYTGPAAELLDCVRVQAFASPDFTGDPVAETTLRYVDIRDSLSPEGSDANAKLIGLPAGSYFLRAYIDTNRNGVHDEWESWGYLNERDQASKPGIFNPVALAASVNPSASNVRRIFIEDCDTDGDWFPDVWEAEQNGGVFVKFKNGAGQGPVKGNAELIGVNTNLDANLDVSAFPMLEALGSKEGLALISGIPPTRIRTVKRSDGTLGIQVDNTVTSVKVTKLDFDANGNVSIQIEAATVSGGLDEGLSKFYGTSLDKTMTVTCIVYRKAKLSDANWTEVGREVVTVGGDEPTTVGVKEPVADNAGFYKVKIIEK